jgi:hypothetical protein
MTFLSSCLGNVPCTTWTTTHPISLATQNGSMSPSNWVRLFVDHHCRRLHISERHEPRFLLKCVTALIGHISRVFSYLFFASFCPFSSHDVVLLGEKMSRNNYCHSAYKECAEVDGTFVPALLWFVQVHFC